MAGYLNCQLADCNFFYGFIVRLTQVYNIFSCYPIVFYLPQLFHILSSLSLKSRFNSGHVTMPCHAMPCQHAMPCHAMPCHVIPCHAMPCHAMPCQKTRHIDTMFDQCWAEVVDGGPTLVQHLYYVSCLLGYHAMPFDVGYVRA